MFEEKDLTGMEMWLWGIEACRHGGASHIAHLQGMGRKDAVRVDLRDGDGAVDFGLDGWISMDRLHRTASQNRAHHATTHVTQRSEKVWIGGSNALGPRDHAIPCWHQGNGRVREYFYLFTFDLPFLDLLTSIS